MTTIIRNIRDLDPNDRSALERIAGQTLSESQRISLQIVSIDAASERGEGQSTDVPSWWKVYEGLADEDVDRLDEAIRSRADLTRSFEQADAGCLARYRHPFGTAQAP